MKELSSSFFVNIATSENEVLYSDLWKAIDFYKPKNIGYFIARKGKISYKVPPNRLLEAIAEELADVRLPSCGIPFWKVSLLDDLAGSLEDYFNEIPSDIADYSAILLPLMSVSRPSHFGSYYSFQLVAVANECRIPAVALEIQTADKRYYYHNLFYDYFLVKNESTKEFLLRVLRYPEDRVFLLKKRYKSILTDSDFTFAANLKFLFDDLSGISGLMEKGVIITIIHRLSERAAFRFLLRALSHLEFNFIPLVVVHPDVSVISLSERQVVEKAYVDVISELPGKEILVLETPRNNISFLTSFSDYIISVSPQVVGDYPYRFDNVVVFNPFYKTLRDYYSEIKNFFTSEEELVEFLNEGYLKDKHRYSVTDAMKAIVRKGKP